MEHQPRAQREEHVEAAPGPSRGTTKPTGLVRRLLEIQRAGGNRVAGHLMAKLEVGPAGDRHEREADEVADRVVKALRQPRLPEPMQDAVAELPQRTVTGKIRRAEFGPDGGPLDDDTSRAINRIRGGGLPLPTATNERMSRAFGTDFSQVRVHTGSESDALNTRISAKAFTVGNDIFFKGGIPDHTSVAGQRLLAHELTHTVQQGGRGVRRTNIDRIQRNGGGKGPTTTKTKPLPPGGKAQPPKPLPKPPVKDKAPKPLPKVPANKKLTERVRDAFDVFEHYDSGTTGKIADAWYQAKKGDADEKKDLNKKGNVKGAAEAKGGKGAAAWALANKHRADLGSLGEAHQVLVDAGFVAGGQLNLTADIEAELGANTVAKAKASFKVFGGIFVKAQAQGFVRKGDRGWWDKGFGGSGKASAFAGVKAKGELDAQFQYKDVGLKGAVEGDAFAGGEAAAEGDFVIDPTAGQISIGGKISAFVGVKAGVKGGGSTTLYGKEAIKFKIGGSVSAGAGGKLGGKFKLAGGKLNINLSAEATAGLGAGANAEVEVDFKPIGVAIWRQSSKAHWALVEKKDPDKIKQILQNPKSVEKVLRKKLEDYSAYKQAQLRAGKATNFGKIEKVQAIIDQFLPRHMVVKEKAGKTVDPFIKRLVIGALALPGKSGIPTVEVKDGKLQKLEYNPDAMKQLSATKVTGTKGSSPGADIKALGD